MKIILLISSFTIILLSCIRKENSHGLEYMPDMYRSPAIEPYVDYAEVRSWKANEEIKNKMSSRVNPFGTIPYRVNNEDLVYFDTYKRLPSKLMYYSNGVDTSYGTSDQDYELSAQDISPMEMIQKNVDNGKILYNRFCIHCHGESGKGDGLVSQNSDAINPPPSAFDIPEGKMFYSITYGKGIMGSHSSQLDQKERWQVISYIKNMNGSPIIKDKIDSSNINNNVDSKNLETQLLNLIESKTDNTTTEKQNSITNESNTNHVSINSLAYETGSSKLDMKKSKSTLDVLVKVLKNSTKTVILEGHTDNVGNEDKNKSLSKQRADEVKKYLISNGINSNKVETKGIGSSNPIANNSTEVGRAKNRRTEIKIK